MNRFNCPMRIYDCNLYLRHRLFVIMSKTYQFKLSVKDNNYDACKTANIKISGRQNLAKWALTGYGGSIHERLFSESNRTYMLAY
jgi:hypothetical protein